MKQILGVARYSFNRLADACSCCLCDIWCYLLLFTFLFKKMSVFQKKFQSQIEYDPSASGVVFRLASWPNISIKAFSSIWFGTNTGGNTDEIFGRTSFSLSKALWCSSRLFMSSFLSRSSHSLISCWTFSSPSNTLLSCSCRIDRSDVSVLVASSCYFPISPLLSFEITLLFLQGLFQLHSPCLCILMSLFALVP